MVAAHSLWFCPLHMILTHGLLLLHTTHDCISWPMVMASANITVNFTKTWPYVNHDCGHWLMIVALGSILLSMANDCGPWPWLWPLAFVTPGLCLSFLAHDCCSWLMNVAPGSWLFPLAHDCFPWLMICRSWLLIVSPGSWLFPLAHDCGLWLMIVARRAYVYKTHVVKWERCLGFHNP